MISKLFFTKRFPSNCVLLLGVLMLSSLNAQTAPANTRLMQINTSKGSVLNLIESTKNHVYHVGTANAELGFDNYTYNNVGNDDLYILKSNISDGSNLWLKTLNAGSRGVIAPKKIYVDAADNVYVYGQFSGTITVGNSSVVSSASVDTFLLKLDDEGNTLWINTFSNSDATFQYEAKIAADSEDVFMTFSKNHLLRLNVATGNLIYDKSYDSGIDFRSVALKNNNLYLAGFTENVVAFGTETIDEGNKGFIVKGDKSANFLASVQTSGAQESSISSMAFTGDGSLVFSGFNKDVMSVKSENGVFEYSYNPNDTSIGVSTVYYTCNIDADLSIVSYLRSSSPIGFGYFSDVKKPKIISSNIIIDENSGNYKLIINGSLSSFSLKYLKNSNGTLVNAYSGAATNSYLISCSSNGWYPGGNQPVSNGLRLSASFDRFMLTKINSRLFTTKVSDLSNGSLKWTKEKTSSKGGNFYDPFVKHLNSAQNELFFSTAVEGKGNFFGTEVNNSTATYSRNVSRLSIDGKAKWTAKIENIYAVFEINPNDFACVDKDDNFLFLVTTSGPSSAFTDASGSTTTFLQATESPSKVIIKLDKDGKIKWSKQILSLSEKNISSFSLITDLAGDVYLNGNSREDASFTLDGQIFNGNSTHIIKLNGTTGSIIYNKSYNGIGDGSLLPGFDNDNNFYLFMSYDSTDNVGNYNFDGVSVPTNPQNEGNIVMLKYNDAGNVVWGKNFYANNGSSSDGLFFDAKFDGSDFAVYGMLYARSPQSFRGLDGLNIPLKYSIPRIHFLAKVSTNGTVIWQKPLHTNNEATDGSFTNINVDPQKNIYFYPDIKDKLFYENTEYNFDAVKGNKVLQKFDLTGALKYNIVVDKNFDGTPMIDVIGEDQINVAAKTKEYSLINYPVADQFSSNMYIATFGDLSKKYLSPQKNYLEINAAVINNDNPPMINEYSFNLINNINWTAESDQSWLTLSSIGLTGKKPLQIISGTGDSKITLSANQNPSSVSRSANVTFSGEGFAAKTVIVTQDSKLGFNGSEIKVITLYPNPTSDFINIKSVEKISTVHIFDMSGKLLISEKLTGEKVSISHLTKGMYIIKLYTQSGVVNSKFIKK